MGSVCQYLGMGRKDVPSYVFMPSFPGFSQALRRSGPYGGYLGSQYDPCFTIWEPSYEPKLSEVKYEYDALPQGRPQLPSLDDLPDITVDRLDGRRSLLHGLDAALKRFGESRAFERADHFQRQALALLTSDKTRAAFDLDQEPSATRDRYGRDLYGNCGLLARRLVEAGVLFTCVYMESKGTGHWDSHGRIFPHMKNNLLPVLDRVYPALIQDLEERRLLDSTLVIVMGEMGRTPRVNVEAGRHHWPQCGFSLLTGGGVKQGHIYGKSDNHAGFPVEDKVSGGDIVATIYKLLDVDPQLHVPDLRGRPIHVAHGGSPVDGVIA